MEPALAQQSGHNIKVFNSAKLYAEEILFPKMDLFQMYQKQADFGSKELHEALNLSPEARDIQRYNGLKGMNDVVYNLLINISSTVKLRKNKQEVAQLQKSIDISKKLKNIFYSERQRFFVKKFDQLEFTEKLNREYFERIKDLIESNYINTEILMTRAKLLFSDAEDEFLADKEILEKIKTEYVEN